MRKHFLRKLWVLIRKRKGEVSNQNKEWTAKDGVKILTEKVNAILKKKYIEKASFVKKKS